MASTDSAEAARQRLLELTERHGQKITARDVATAHLASATIRHLQELADRNLRTYSDALHTSVRRGIQLDATREMLEQIKEILG